MFGFVIEWVLLLLFDLMKIDDDFGYFIFVLLGILVEYCGLMD